MVPLLRACLHRQTLIVLRNILRSIHRFFTPFLTMSSKSASEQDPQSSSPDPPPFDPTRPSVPISYPIKTLEDLESRSYFESFHYPFNRSSVSLQAPSGSSSLDKPKILVCHDMAGGYLDDKWVQGGSNEGAYAIWHWYLIDVFVYFAHTLVTLPPPCWTNTAHKHGVKVLGTFITEWDEGRVICNKLLATKESTHMYAERLAELAAALGFDGWLINMEVELDVEQIPNMKEFVGHLTKVMHSSVPGSLVIWYDSVTIEGKLDWQNQLNENNKPFFDLCDGIFINYTWKEEYPKHSAAVAGERKHDVYMGIDVFGRNTYGGGEWNTHVALDLIKKDAVSAAIFAPGWVYETKQPPDFETAQNRWWSLVEKSWGVVQNYPKTLPFYSNFDQGHGYHISIDGIHVSGSPWCNISSQGFQPLLEFIGDPTPAIQVLVNFKEPSYSGGGNITFKGTLGDNAYSTTRLFLGKLLLGHLPVHFNYSVNSDGNSLVGLSLEFSSSTHERTSVLLASRGNTLLTMNQFSSKFDKIIMPHQVKQLDTSPGWVLQESSIAMNGFTLTEIHAVCYMSKPERAQLISPPPSLAEFTATLGHVTITTSKQNPDFPPSSSWIVEGQYVKWVPSPQDTSKSLSVKITWKLKSGDDDSVFPKYNIYVEKLSEHVIVNVYGAPEAQHEYLGVAQVRAFYVSDLVVPAGTSGVKFVIQVCGVDGSVQKLGDSPFLQLDVQG